MDPGGSLRLQCTFMQISGRASGKAVVYFYMPLIRIDRNRNGYNRRGTNLSELADDYRLLESTRCRCSSPKGIGEARPALTFDRAYRAAIAYLENRSKRRASN